MIGLGAIIMDAQDVWQAYQAAPGATLIASHMEAVNHAVLTRRALREFAIEKKHDGPPADSGGQRGLPALMPSGRPGPRPPPHSIAECR